MPLLSTSVIPARGNCPRTRGAAQDEHHGCVIEALEHEWRASVRPFRLLSASRRLPNGEGSGRA